MKNMLITLANFHYELGFIGCHEFNERIQVAQWLSEEDGAGSPDPRLESDEEPQFEEQKNHDLEFESASSGLKEETSKPDDKDWIEICCLEQWVFTKSDPDPYPSIPHGHYLNQKNKWPKLNPYTGRVFKAMHQEDITMRLSKKDMQKLWRDKKLKVFCREMITWYKKQYPHITFPVRHPLKMPTW